MGTYAKKLTLLLKAYAVQVNKSNSGRGPLFVLEIRGLTDRLNIKQNKVLKYILRFQYCFCCTIIYFDIWCQFIEKILSNHDMVW